MYPDRELIRLASRKALLRQAIAYRRVQCAQAATRATRPLAWLDRVVAFWRRLPPLVHFAALPLGALLGRSLVPRRGMLGTLLRWAPLAFTAVRSFAGERSASRRD
jgi:hypothetical protein